jgi:hypothetical protein
MIDSDGSKKNAGETAGISAMFPLVRRINLRGGNLIMRCD